MLFLVVPPFTEDEASSCTAALPQQLSISSVPYWQSSPSILLPFVHPSFRSSHFFFGLAVTSPLLSLVVNPPPYGSQPSSIW